MAAPPASHDLVFSPGPQLQEQLAPSQLLRCERAYAFDWWITPARSMLAMLEPGFRFHLEPVHGFRECYEAPGLAPVSPPVAAPAP